MNAHCLSLPVFAAAADHWLPVVKMLLFEERYQQQHPKNWNKTNLFQCIHSKSNLLNLVQNLFVLGFECYTYETYFNLNSCWRHRSILGNVGPLHRCSSSHVLENKLLLLLLLVG